MVATCLVIRDVGIISRTRSGSSSVRPCIFRFTTKDPLARAGWKHLKLVDIMYLHSLVILAAVSAVSSGVREFVSTYTTAVF
jgi:hypothetical protein